MVFVKRLFVFISLVAVAAVCQTTDGFSTRGQNKAAQQDSAITPAEDISGMYAFLKEGEFLQIDLDGHIASGYISRLGDSDSDRGVFLDQFFTKTLIQGHEVSFTTKPLHGIWYEFKGRFDRGPAKSKAQDGFYILRGTLKELSTNPDKSIATHSREVEFKLLAQPDDSDESAPSKSKKSKG